MKLIKITPGNPQLSLYYDTTGYVVTLDLNGVRQSWHRYPKELFESLFPYRDGQLNNAQRTAIEKELMIKHILTLRDKYPNLTHEEFIERIYDES